MKNYIELKIFILKGVDKDNRLEAEIDLLIIYHELWH